MFKAVFWKNIWDGEDIDSSKFYAIYKKEYNFLLFRSRTSKLHGKVTCLSHLRQYIGMWKKKNLLVLSQMNLNTGYRLTNMILSGLLRELK